MTDEEREMALRPVLVAQRRNDALRRQYEHRKHTLSPADRALLVRVAPVHVRPGRTLAPPRSRPLPPGVAPPRALAAPAVRQRTQLYRAMLENIHIAEADQEQVRSSCHCQRPQRRAGAEDAEAVSLPPDALARLALGYVGEVNGA